MAYPEDTGKKESNRQLRIRLLCWMYWGASLMWLVDAVFQYARLQTEYFNATLAELCSDAFLGLSAVALGLLVWLAVLLIQDPKGKWKSVFRQQ